MWLEPGQGARLHRQGQRVAALQKYAPASTAQLSQSSSFWLGCLCPTAAKSGPHGDISQLCESGLTAASKQQQALQVIYPCSMALCSKSLKRRQMDASLHTKTPFLAGS